MKRFGSPPAAGEASPPLELALAAVLEAAATAAATVAVAGGGPAAAAPAADEWLVSLA